MRNEKDIIYRWETETQLVETRKPPQRRQEKKGAPIENAYGCNCRINSPEAVIQADKNRSQGEKNINKRPQNKTFPYLMLT